MRRSNVHQTGEIFSSRRGRSPVPLVRKVRKFLERQIRAIHSNKTDLAKVEHVVSVVGQIAYDSRNVWPSQFGHSADDGLQLPCMNHGPVVIVPVGRTFARKRSIQSVQFGDIGRTPGATQSNVGPSNPHCQFGGISGSLCGWYVLLGRGIRQQWTVQTKTVEDELTNR